MHDAFISYSRRDSAFADSLERRLEKYKPPKELGLPLRFLDIFRDTKDFTGPDYRTSLARHLQDSAALIVLCSPDARASEYVNDEIRSFAATKGTDRIVPVLVRGLPNNEVKAGQEADKAFPEALYDYLEMPLAVNYLGFEPRRDRVDKGAYFDAWSTLLANLFGLSRSEVEQRERKRRARRLQIAAASAISVISVLVVALVFSLISRSEALRQAIAARKQTSTRLAIQALEKIGETPEEALNLAIQAVETYDRHGDPPVSRAIEALHKARLSFGGGRPAIPWREDQASLVFSPDLKWIATSSDSGTIRFSKAGSGVVEILQPPPGTLEPDEHWAGNGKAELLFTGKHLVAARETTGGHDRRPREWMLWYWRLDETGIAAPPELISKIEDDAWSGLQLRASPDSRWLTWREGRDRLFLHAIGSSRPPFEFETLDTHRPLTAFSDDSTEFVFAVRSGLQKVRLLRPEPPAAPDPVPPADSGGDTKNVPDLAGPSRDTAVPPPEDPNLLEAVPAEVLAYSWPFALKRSLAIATVTRDRRKREDGTRAQGFSRIAILTRNGDVAWWDLDRDSAESTDIGSMYSAYADDMKVYGLEESEQDVTFEFDPSGRSILAAVAHHSGEFGVISRIDLAGTDGWVPLVMEQLQGQTTASLTRAQGTGLGIDSGYKLISQKRLGGKKAWPFADMGALTLGMDGTLLFREFENGNSALIATGVNAVSFNHHGRFLPLGMRNGKLRLFALDGDGAYIDLSAHDSPVESVSQDGGQSRIITSDGMGVSRAWNLPNPVLRTDEGDVGTVDWRWATMDGLPEGVAWDLSSPDPFAQAVEAETDVRLDGYRLAVDRGGERAARLETDDEDPSHVTVKLWTVEDGRLGPSPIVSRVLDLGERPDRWRWNGRGRLAMSGGRALFFFQGTNFAETGAWIIDLNDSSAEPQPLIVPERRVQIRSVSRNLARMVLGYDKRRSDGVDRVEVVAIQPSPGDVLLVVEGTSHGDLSRNGRWFSADGRLFDLDGDRSKPRAEKESSDAWPFRFVFGDGKPPLFVGDDKKLRGLDNAAGANTPLQSLAADFEFSEVAWDESSTWLALGDEDGRVWIIDGRPIVDIASLATALRSVTVDTALPKPWVAAARDRIVRFELLPKAGWAFAETDRDYYILWRGTPESGWAEPLVFHERELLARSGSLECRPDGQQCFVGGQFLTFDESQMVSMARALLSGRPLPQ